jgi:hypothetical protein
MRYKILKNNKLLRSKSGLSFFMLLALVAVVLFVLFVIVVSGPNVASIYDKEFKTTNAVDTLSSTGLYNNYYVDFLIKNSLDEFKISFFTDLELEVRANGLSIDEDKFLGCKFQDNLILYNEAYLISQKDSGLDSDLTSTGYSCFPDFSSDFSVKFVEYANDELNSMFNNFFRSGNSDLISVDINSIDSEILVDVNYKSFEEVGSGGVYISDKISTSYNLGNFDGLIDTLNIVLPKMSMEVKASIISCKKTVRSDVLDSDLFCIEEVFGNLFKAVDTNLFDDFIFDFSRLENSNVLDFYGIYIGVIDKESKKNIFDFSVVLENNLPFGQVDYSLKNYEKLDNVIELDIVKPNLKNSSLSGFVVLYSYENFLDMSSYSGYSKLISLLENSNIPDGFENLGIKNSVGEYRGSDKGSGLDLSLVFVNSLVFDDSSVMNLKIHQIWNEDTEEFDLIENRKVYFAVFAVDSRFNYFTDEELLNEVFSGIIPEKKLGPKPVTKEQVKTNGNIAGFDNSIEFEILDYEDDSLKEFELYVVKGNMLIFNKVCLEEMMSSCKKVTLEYSKDTSNKYLISSNSGGVDTSIYGNNVINTDFVLGDGSDIRFYLIPVDSDSVGFYESVQLEYSLKKVHSFYDFSNTPVLTNVFQFSSKIIDKRTPDLNSIKDLSLKYVGNSLNFNWGKTDINSDVDKVLIKVINFDDSSEFRILTVSSSGETSYSPNFNTAEVVYAVPIDKSGNSLFSNVNIGDSTRLSGVLVSK